MSPRELALELLHHRFGPTAREGSSALDGLAGFQRDAVPRLELALERYRGALLADSVGLGKTHIGAAVVRRALARGGSAGVIVPTTLLRQWKRVLRGATPASFATHAQLSRGGVAALDRASLLVVDEAHAFRNPRTRRYAALARLTAERPVLLVTATPVNNSLRDLYWLLRLFAADDAFRTTGVSDLGAAVREAESSGRFGRIAAVLAEVAVRRTREHITIAIDEHGTTGTSAPAGRPGGALRFPAREPPVEITYPVNAAVQRDLLHCIDHLALAPWTVEQPSAGALLVRLVLLKRLESSRAAFSASLRRLLRTLLAFRDALHAGQLLSPAERRTRGSADADQLALDALVLQPLPRALDVASLDHATAADIQRVERSLRHLALEPRDTKRERLERFISAELGDRPLLVFTEFRDTAVDLWRVLAPRVPIALIHGGGAWLGRSPVARRVAVERFAPRSNGRPQPPARERPRVLVATDVLAEGLNLQDAADLVSYDLPWNPVRMLQRMGRIDRLGSRHDRVRGYYFAPDQGLESMLRLLARLRTKLAAIRGSVGEEAEVIAHGARVVPAAHREMPVSRVRMGTHRDGSPADALFGLEERLRAAWKIHSGEDALAGLPLALPLKSSEVAAAPRAAARLRSAAPGPGHGGTPPVLYVPGVRSPGVEAVLFFDCGGGQRTVALGRHSRDDARLGAEVLLAALTCTDDSEPLSNDAAVRLTARAEHWLRRPAGPARTPRLLRHVRSRLLGLLQARPGGPTPAECARVDRLLTALRAPLGVAQELALRALPGTRDFDDLAAQLERALGNPAPRRAAVPAGITTPRFLGGFRLSGG